VLKSSNQGGSQWGSPAIWRHTSRLAEIRFTQEPKGWRGWRGTSAYWCITRYRQGTSTKDNIEHFPTDWFILVDGGSKRYSSRMWRRPRYIEYVPHLQNITNSECGFACG